MSQEPRIERLNTLTARVEKVLKNYPITRDDDYELWSKVCEMFYPPLERPIFNYRDVMSVLRQLPSLDHLTRARRKVIQNHDYKLYLPNSWYVAMNRGMEREVWQQYSRENQSELTKREKAFENQFESNIPITHNDQGELL